jgi:hypothetical protein
MSLEIVQKVRDKLFPGNQPLNDRVKAFQITKHVAWILRSRGFRLVKAKPGSLNNIEGHTGDIIATADGFHVDILEDGEGKAVAAWQEHHDQAEKEAIKPRVAAPIPMPPLFDPPLVEEPEGSGGPAPSVDLTPVLEAVSGLRMAQHEEMAALARKVDELTGAVRELVANQRPAAAVDLTPVLAAINDEREIEIRLPALGTARGRLVARN